MLTQKTQHKETPGPRATCGLVGLVAGAVKLETVPSTEDHSGLVRKATGSWASPTTSTARSNLGRTSIDQRRRSGVVKDSPQTSDREIGGQNI